MEIVIINYALAKVWISPIYSPRSPGYMVPSMIEQLMKIKDLNLLALLSRGMFSKFLQQTIILLPQLLTPNS
jgi:hypothetical protein